MLRTYYPSSITLHDDDTLDPKPVSLRIARLNPQEAAWFKAGVRRCEVPPADAMLPRRPTGEEQAKQTVQVNGKPVEVFVVSDLQVQQRRLSEMTPEQRAAFEQARDTHEEFANAFYHEAISKYVSVEPGQLQMEENGQVRDLVDGKDLVRFYAARSDVLQQLLALILIENTSTGAQKKALRSLRASTPSSSAPETGAAGKRPDATAAPAKPEGSASPAAVLGPSVSIPSGSTVN